MPEVLDLNHFVENVLSSYEVRIESISSIFDTTHLISILDTKKEEREEINTQLRDVLARNQHLRKKDFDNMMRGILSAQDEGEKEAKNLLKVYLNEQREMAQTIRESLGRFRDSLSRGEAGRLKDFQALIQEILAKQDERKSEVTSKLKEFQQEQKTLAERLKELLAKGRELRIRDLKLMLQEFKSEHRERLADHEERRMEVRRMLGAFNKERTEWRRHWGNRQR